MYGSSRNNALCSLQASSAVSAIVTYVRNRKTRRLEIAKTIDALCKFSKTYRAVAGKDKKYSESIDQKLHHVSL